MKLPKLKFEIKKQNLQSKKLFRFSFFALLLILSSILVLNRVNAQGLVRTFTVTPPTASITGDPGYYTEGTMGVINDSDTALTFRADMRDFIVQDNNGTPEILPANTLMKTYSAAAWMGVTPQVFTIQPKQRQNLNYYIQIPGNARPGGHYAAVVFTPANPKSQAQSTGAIVNGQIGTLFSIAVNGPIKENAIVSKFFANFFQEYGPVNISSQIKNLGDLHIKPKGYITVSDLLGRKAVLPLKENNIFPQAGRDYENTFGSKLMIGRFKAELLGSYGVNNNLPLAATLYFWVFPWKIVVVITLVVVAVIFGILYYRKNIKKTNKPSEKVEAEKAPEEPAK